jgi:hypothetical protein
VDVKAQSSIIAHPLFVPFLKRTNSVQLITQIFTTTQTNDFKRRMEPFHPVHAPWVELTEANKDITWEPNPNDSYTGSQGGPKHGLSNYIINVARQTCCLAMIFLAILPLAFFNTVSKQTHNYYHEEWVVETVQRDRDGNPKKKKLLKPCTADTPGARHRVKDNKHSNEVTTCFVLAWVALLILQGAHFGTQKRSSKKMWRKAPYEIDLPYVRNSCSYIYFAYNSRRPAPGECGYDLLFKVAYALDTMMGGIQKVWIAGKNVAVDESMIRYMVGR